MRKMIFFGFSALTNIKRRIEFARDYLTFRKLTERASPRFALRWKDRYPCLNDKTVRTGFDRHYVYHTAWAARIVAETKPAFHIDVSSSLYFSAIVSAFCPVKFYDYRLADLRLSALESRAADLSKLPFDDNSIDSLSCMHVVEHVGLGRYGDVLDADGDLKAIAELKRVLAPGGNLLFVVPVGRSRIEFNAHRIYEYQQVREYFSALRLHEFALIPDTSDQGGLVYQATKEMADRQNYGCGCFWLKKM